MELSTDIMGELAGITSARLVERTSGEGVLSLEFAGFGPDWLEYMEEVSLLHREVLIFHGKVTRVSRTNSGGAMHTVAEVHNFFWLLERQTLEQQLADLLEGDRVTAEGSGSGNGAWQALPLEKVRRRAKGQIGKYQALKVGGGGYCVSWLSATQPMRLSAPGWRYTTLSRTRSVSTGGEDEVAVLCSDGVAGRQMWAVTDKLVTTASALWRMRRKAADVQYIVDYAAGTVTAMGIGELPVVTLDTADGAVLEASDIEPQYSAAVKGVVIAWTNDVGQTWVHKWPQELDEAQDGVKVFTLGGRYYVESWDKVAQEYYEAAAVLQYGGTVRLVAAKLEGSLLGRRLNLTGPGTHDSWHSMDAVVTACEWDMLDGTVTVSLGREYADPEFAEAEEMEDGGDYVEEFERNMSGSSAGKWPWLDGDGSESGGGSGGSGSSEPKYRVERVQLREPDGCSPGTDGWELSWQGYVWSGNTNAYAHRRQLMRFEERSGKVVLQVAMQEQDASGSWEVA